MSADISLIDRLFYFVVVIQHV